MITWVNKDISIGAIKFSGRKKPAMCIMEGNTVQVYGYFNSDDCAILFMRTLEELLGVTKLDKSEDINADVGKSV